MRETHKTQPTLTEPWLDLPHAKELKAISDLLDQHPILGALVAQDISRGKPKRSAGLTGEQALPFTQDGAELTITLPASPPKGQEHAFVVQVHCDRNTTPGWLN